MRGRVSNPVMSTRKVDGAKILYDFFKDMQTALGSTSIIVRAPVMIGVMRKHMGKFPWEAVVNFLEELENQGLIRILEDHHHTYRGYRLTVLECTPWPGLTKHV